MEALSQIQDPGIPKLFETIYHDYLGGEDIYTLTEYVEGQSLRRLQPSTENLTYIQQIISSLLSSAEAGYYYFYASLGHIRIAAGQVKFINPDDFEVQGSDNENFYIDAYELLYEFFEEICRLLPESAQWVEKIRQAFPLLDLLKQRYDAEDNETEEFNEWKETFNATLIKTVLKQLRELFSLEAYFYP